MTVYQPVGCALIEQLELACLQRREVTLILHDQAVHRGRILDVETRADKSEWLRLSCPGAEAPLTIRLDAIAQVQR